MNPMSSKEQAPADIGLLKWSSLGGFLYYALNLIVSVRKAAKTIQIWKTYYVTLKMAY